MVDPSLTFGTLPSYRRQRGCHEIVSEPLLAGDEMVNSEPGRVVQELMTCSKKEQALDCRLRELPAWLGFAKPQLSKINFSEAESHVQQGFQQVWQLCPFPA
jgi:hypothetical protein